MADEQSVTHANEENILPAKTLCGKARLNLPPDQSLAFPSRAGWLIVDESLVPSAANSMTLDGDFKERSALMSYVALRPGS
jgi:hypothetical protein